MKSVQAQPPNSNSGQLGLISSLCIALLVAVVFGVAFQRSGINEIASPVFIRCNNQFYNINYVKRIATDPQNVKEIEIANTESDTYNARDWVQRCDQAFEFYCINRSSIQYSDLTYKHNKSTN